MLTQTTVGQAAEYFQLLSLEASCDQQEFWDYLILHHDEKAYEFQELVSTVSKENQRIVYPTKNQDLQFSLDVAKMLADFYLHYCTWVSEASYHPKRILDIGCDNGILTCFYAFLYPEAEVVGIDKTKDGIRIASELATRLGLTNITFQQMDYRNIRRLYPSDSFDMITSVRVFHEIIGTLPVPLYWSLEEFLRTSPLSSDYRYLEIIEELLTEDGVYLSTERLESPAALGLWSNMLEAVDLSIDWESSSFIEFHETGVRQKAPIVVATQSNRGKPTMEGITQLYLRNVENKAIGSFSSVAAELMFHQQEPKQFQTGRLLKFHDHWYQIRYEIWSTDTAILVYGCGNMGYRKLEILPLAETEKAYLIVEELFGQYSEQAAVGSYTSLEEREELSD
ncbi:class I SAM-dependent methyltransferase [Anaerobacillus alkaliphilus]|uniref:Class I SAM-dependent methyltransferase n=1 Tax=Anaerobacillus alkaliphilus TaxID=1548597 RepID=A0A4Q0VYG6_9BACI|nr:class I SAM-dependent methyltransferase [Anaerobacillus alkaliphilus]RXJ04599.1 class I SAM-dependent methyltransferase [Anaerobacillus alkaliphilus]